MLSPLVIPSPTVARKVPGYKMPEQPDSLLSWDFVITQMDRAQHYWLGSTFPDARPHAVPIWGLWHHNRIHFEGGASTTWATNLRRNPRATIHPPDGEKVVIIHGTARAIEDDELTQTEWDDLDSRFRTKYDVPQGSPYWYIEPTRVLAWNGGALDTMTRWTFAETPEA